MRSCISIVFRLWLDSWKERRSGSLEIEILENVVGAWAATRH